MSRRAVVVVLDACGVGALPDAQEYGDAGADTLAHVAEAEGGLQLPTLERLGLGSIVPLTGVGPVPSPVLHGRLHPLGPGKDSITGHWELMGVSVAAAPPAYPDGIPPDVVASLERATGRGVVGNTACNGIEAIERFGELQVESGDLIVYTSQDSVLQIAAHVDVVGTEELYAACASARSIMRGEHAVARVIARPFTTGAAGRFERTEGRRDFALPPPGPSYLSELQSAGVPVHAVGKVGELFAQVGVDHDHAGPTNARAIDATTKLLHELESGLVFVNLVETDQVYGHRKDIPGFHAALRKVDDAVALWLGLLSPDDLLVLTADHGCDPTTPGTDHTREYAPLLASFEGHEGRRHDGPLADVGASALRWLTGRDAPLAGTPFAA
jgi:phosphopentomutase